MPFTRAELDRAAEIVYAAMPPTPQYAWPLLRSRFGMEIWVKHENHTPIGAFKVRGGLVYLDRMKRERPGRGAISATRGNHGQSLAFAGRRLGVSVTLLVPHGNAREKNAAMGAWGAELMEHGRDFDAARLRAAEIAAERGLEMVPPFHRDLVLGVASYALELFTSVPDLDAVYVPIGCGSGICGLIAVRDLLGLSTDIVGVVSAGAPAYAHSFAEGRCVETEHAETFADGMAVRVPVPAALDAILRGAARVVEVDDDAVAEAIRALHEDTHNLAEGAGAAPLAALAKERDAMRGRRAAVILSGGNIDRAWAAEVLAGRTPRVDR